MSDGLDASSPSVVSALAVAALLVLAVGGWFTMIGLGMVGVSVTYWEGAVLSVIARLVLANPPTARR